MFYVRTCRVCGAGGVGFLRCDDGATIVVMCDECDAVWLHPDRTGSRDDALYTSPPAFQVPGLACSLTGGSSGWATRAEVEAAGWQAYIAGEGKALGEP